MTYEEFKDYITSKCLYDAIYEDQEGREIIVMTVLDAYSMASKLAQRTWVGLTDAEQSFVFDQVKQIVDSKPFWVRFADSIEAKLKEKNT
jgi:hypothetical protein